MTTLRKLPISSDSRKTLPTNSAAFDRNSSASVR